jgi:hypothetical protein
MIAKKVTGIAPRLEQLAPPGTIHTHPADEQRGLELPLIEHI